MSDAEKVPLPLPLQIGGSQVTQDRLSGPPSKMYPVLRDLLEDAERGTHEIIVEFDTINGGRKRGKLRSISGAENFWYAPPIEPRGAEKFSLDPQEWTFHSQPSQLSFKDIIAFRVLEVRGALPTKP